MKLGPRKTGFITTISPVVITGRPKAVSFVLYLVPFNFNVLILTLLCVLFI